MSDNPHLDPEEQQLADLLRRSAGAAPGPDEEFLAALRQKTKEAFAARWPHPQNNSKPFAETATPPTSEPTTAPPPHPAPERAAPPSRSRPPVTRASMLTLALRGLAALVAVVSLVSAWLVGLPEKTVQGGVPFSHVLEQMRSNDSLQLRLHKQDQAVEIWVRRPGLVRREETPQRYEIAAGSRLWKIDEAANTVTEGDSRWFLGPDKQIDLLAFLDLDVTDAQRLLTALPRKRTDYRGHECDVYESVVETREGSLRIAAYADARTQQLAGIEAWPVNPIKAAAGPLAELQLVAVNPPVDENKFIVSKSLSDDGRIGKVKAAQGVVLLRPMLASRWTPVGRGLLIKPGDWIKTDLRGANAVKVTLTSDFEVTLGPGTILETISPTQARLHSGVAQVSLPPPPKGVDRDGISFELLAPRTGSRKLLAEGKILLRVDRDEHLVDIPQTPVWLAGFEGTSSNESLGSLIVQIDGRNEPLTVGYHKVSVEIRDQIARTTIEESFVNHTNSRLEGIFHFPLPQDASISGFGMWIGNDLVEADVVEKQRAREIFEDILRQKRDPGLLEWTGGNIFKARVFPIEGHSEKRVKIVYTQILPLRGNRYRYSYGLRSELLQTRPLRELDLKVTVNSALGLKDITCPTHSARISKTAHSGQVEFTAQEYTPNRDFEVVCEVGGQQPDVVVIPHRRGDDGYFLMQLTPPGAAGNWQRELLPEGAPLKLVLLCDTSSSMDSEKRRQQREFVATVLSTLGPNDRFQLAAADVGTVWPFAEPVAATPDNLTKSRQFLEERVSLGWTDLNRAFTDVLRKAPADAQVIYIGDGIVTAGETDPHSFVKQLRRLVLGSDEKPGEQRRGFHAVTVGNSFEGAIVKGIAGLTGGSVRSIGGEQTPQAVALELLNEIAQPGLRDINVEFRGVKVAAVYPEKLPNIPAGTQQILVGRYLPEGRDQHGEVVVTGKRGNEQVRYVARINLKDAEEGNSFIPRLWARGHLERLLQQGQAAAVRDQIIALSEEFHIMTPYTSLLVLESDADRERYGVKRRYEIRDGEKFFAEGRGNANFELLQQQTKRAGDWRIGLRRRILRSLAGLGRNPAMFSQVHAMTTSGSRYRSLGFQAGGGGFGGSDLRSVIYMSDGPMPATAPAAPGEPIVIDQLQAAAVVGGLVDEALGDDAKDFKPGQQGQELEEGLSLSMKNREAKEDRGPVDELESIRTSVGWEPGEELPSNAGYRLQASEISDFDKRSNVPMRSESSGEFIDWEQARPMNGPVGRGFSEQLSGRYHYHGYQPDYTQFIHTIFPSISSAPGKPTAAVKDPENWPVEALALSRSLLRKDILLALKGGVEFRRVSRNFDPRWNRRTYQHEEFILYSPTAWLTRPEQIDGQTIIHFSNEREVGAWSRSFLLGRVRPAVVQDRQSVPVPLPSSMLVPVHEQYRDSRSNVRVEPAGDNRSRLIISMGQDVYERRILIDTARHVILQEETFQNGKSISSVSFDDFVQVAGIWWPRHTTTNDHSGRKVGESTAEVRELTTAPFTQQMQQELADKSRVQFLKSSPVKLADARRKAADGSADVDDRMTLLLHFVQLQQWDDVLKQIDAIEKLATDKPGIRWLRTLALQTMRRQEEARQRYLAEASQLANAKAPDELFLTEFILNHVTSLSSSPEQLELLLIVKPVYARQPADIDAMFKWETRLANAYEGMSRIEEALALRKALATRVPWETYTQTDYARRLHQYGPTETALAWLQQQIDRKVERTPDDIDNLHSSYAQLLRVRGDWDGLVKFTAKWIERNRESTTPYSEHFSALFFNDQVATAYALADEWLKAARIEGQLDRAAKARLDASLNFALGNINHLYLQFIHDRWFGRLTETAQFFLRHRHHFDVAQRIMGDYRFNPTESGDRLRAEALQLLQTDLKRLTPTQINVLLNWTFSGRLELSEPINGRKQLDSSELPLSIWEKIAAELHARWSDTADKDEKNLLSESLRLLYGNRFHGTKLLPFLRERLKDAAPEFKQQYASVLFEDLLSRPWSSEIETELFARLHELSTATEVAERLQVQLPALLRTVDGLIRQHQARDEKEWRDKGGLDKLTRQQIAQKQAEFSKAARIAMATKLAEEAAKEPNPTLAAWMRMERVWIDVHLNQRLPEAADECWKVLGEAPSKPDSEEAWAELTPAEQLQRGFDSLLRHRAWITVQYLAVRRDAAPPAVARVLKYIDSGMSLEGPSVNYWRFAKFRFLIALDRAEELEKDLQTWIRSDDPTAPWRILLAYLTAERGKIAEAIELFEAAKSKQLLSATDLRQLADWYLVMNRRADYERTRIDAYKLVPEHQLGNLLYQAANRWSQTNVPLPSELDENILFAYKALFEKSANPANYAYQIRTLYAACRDFRLLQMLPNAVLGRTPQHIYPFLQTLYGNVLYEVRNEATADEIVATIQKLRTPERTPTDLRALDLLESIVERRSAEVLNQPGPHVQKSLAALKRAFDRKWGEGEPRMMAGFLHNLGTLPHAPLVDEQLRELRLLRDMTKAGSRDHLAITSSLCQLMFYNYSRRDEAMREMEAEVTAYQNANGGRWLMVDNDILGTWLGFLETMGRFADSEVLLLKLLKDPEHPSQRQWFRDQLLTVYNNALRAGGEVSLGKDSTLFMALVKRFQIEAKAAADENLRYNLILQMVNTLQAGQHRSLPEVREEVRKFAFETLPILLRRQQSLYRSTVTAPTHLVRDVLGNKAGLRYVVERMEQYPQRFDGSYEDAWNVFSSQFAEWRAAVATEKADWSDLEPRVLALTLAELRRFLRTGEQRGYNVYYHNHSYFWAEKADVFARVANEVYNEQPTSGRIAARVAHYLWHGLQQQNRAVEVLLISQRQGILTDQDVSQLIDWLQQLNRHGESIALLEPLIHSHLDAIHHYQRLMAAYFHMHRDQQLKDLVEQIEKHFHDGGRWNESNISALAQACQNCNLIDKAILYFQEAISLHKRTHTWQPGGDSTLASLNQQLAYAYSRKGDTIHAAEAASEALVVWGFHSGNRSSALQTLEQILRDSKDLDRYVKHLDSQSAQQNADSPLLRKMVGKAYQHHNKPALAIPQFEIALVLQPNDREANTLLIEAYDKTGRRADAARQILKQIDFDRHNLKLYELLADRLKDNEAEAERAATSLIEYAPSETENHTAFAELRQRQNRWGEAIPHWERVAELRRLEPTGLLKLAEAQIHEKRWDDVRRSLQKLKQTGWPGRFGDMDSQIRNLEEQLRKAQN